MTPFEHLQGWNRTPDVDRFGCEKTNPDAAPRDASPSDRMPEDIQSEQLPLDLIDEASMESFPCSDPPSYTRCHA